MTSALKVGLLLTDFQNPKFSFLVPLEFFILSQFVTNSFAPHKISKR